ncbi:hypothetical protein IGI57_001692 [Enterococcus sp. DIV0213j]
MIPVLDEVIKIKDFSEETDTNYVALLSKELRYCRTHANEIYAKALEVYSFGTDETHPQYINCCKFKVLELNCKKTIIIFKRHFLCLFYLSNYDKTYLLLISTQNKVLRNYSRQQILAILLKT